MGPSCLMGGVQRLKSSPVSILKIRICQEILMVNRYQAAVLPPSPSPRKAGFPNDSTSGVKGGAVMGRLSKIFS
jgi:hypothetical protein